MYLAKHLFAGALSNAMGVESNREIIGNSVVVDSRITDRHSRRYAARSARRNSRPTAIPFWHDNDDDDSTDNDGRAYTGNSASGHPDNDNT
jgi:hypothetical protein